MPPYSSNREGRTTPDRSAEIPEPIRAAAGLAVAALDQARQLPSAITGLPVRVAGLAMQTSLRLQQRYAGLVAKGDEVLAQMRRPVDEHPPWATFDDDIVDVADAVTEDIGVNVTAADEVGTQPASDVALPPLPGTTRRRPPRKTPSTPRMGHAPSAFDLADDVATASAIALPTTAGTTTDDDAEVTDSASNGHARTSSAPVPPVPGYDAFTLAQLRARLRTFDAATLQSLLNYEREQRARTSYLTMLENRLSRSTEQG